MIYDSPYPDITVPDTTVTELVLGGAAERFGDRVALIDGHTGERLTYTALCDAVRSAAAGFAELGVRPGDTVAVMSHNQPRFAVAAHAALSAGASVTTINPILTTDEVAKQLMAAKVRAIVSSEEAAPRALDAAAMAGVKHVLSFGNSARPFDELLHTGANAPSPTPDPATAVAALPFSSGTTGKSKGVKLTHRNLVANLIQSRAVWPVGPDDVLVAVPPFFHILGFTMVLNFSLLGGATVVTLPRFELDEFLGTVKRHGATRAYFVPPMLLAIANSDHSDIDAGTSLKYGVCGAAPVDADIVARAERRLGCFIRQGYGMTEASPAILGVADADCSSTPSGCVGTLMPSTQARLVQPGTDVDVAPGSPGELLIRGPQVMSGYLDNAEATAETITGGWLHTGDVVRIDADGFYWVVDRCKELIKYKGYQVAPAELEAVLLTHPDVRDTAVIGVPHREGGEAPKAFVVTDAVLDADELMSYVAERVAPYKKIRSVEFVETIPKSATGKILRRLLKT